MKKRLFFPTIGTLLLGVTAWLAADWWLALPAGRTAQYVGRQSCARCHASQAALWEGSDHDRAMDLATPEFVLGDFNDTQLEHHGVTSKMSRRGDEFFVETEGPDGERAEFRVKYVFGYRPLQQYLAELDGGRVQVLPVSWDVEKGRWFYANPDPPFGPADPLHWTGSAQNWNHMCADCHSTNFQKNYDVATDTHHYSFSEIDVSCEACHGPGSIHVELAEARSVFWDRRYGYGLAKLKGKDSRPQLEACAPCHSRREHVYPDFKAGDRYLDHYSLTLLEDHLYHPDGQIDDEVYVYGSFLQSLMYRKGVRCSDCHDPHTTRIKAEGNKLCAQCHLPAKYDTPSHHRHAIGSRGALCVECHMPEKTYMVVDPRRDHSLRIPRPDLTVKLGVPNACNQCHDKPHETPQWAADKVVEWYGPKRRDDPHFGEILAAGRKGNSAAESQVIELTTSREQGPIVRATAVSLLATRYSDRRSQQAVLDRLQDGDPLVRAAALRLFDGRQAASTAEWNEFRSHLVPRLRDPFRLVRTEAARLLAAQPREMLDGSESAALDAALEEYQAGLLQDADRAGAQMNLAILYDHIGKTQQAVEAYRIAIRQDPAWAGPRSNLAELLSRLGDETEAQQLRGEEAELLLRDSRLLPENALIHYRLGLTLYLLGREDEAAQALEQATKLEPDSADFLMTLALLYEKQRRWGAAIDAARRLLELHPDNPMFRQMLENFRRGAGDPASGGR